MLFILYFHVKKSLMKCVKFQIDLKKKFGHLYMKGEFKIKSVEYDISN